MAQGAEVHQRATRTRDARDLVPGDTFLLTGLTYVSDRMPARPRWLRVTGIRGPYGGSWVRLDTRAERGRLDYIELRADTRVLVR